MHIFSLALFGLIARGDFVVRGDFGLEADTACDKCVKSTSVAAFRQNIKPGEVVNDCSPDLNKCDPKANTTQSITLCYAKCNETAIHDPGFKDVTAKMEVGRFDLKSDSCYASADCSDCKKKTACKWAKDASGLMGCVEATILAENKNNDGKFVEITQCPTDCTTCTAAGMDGIFKRVVTPTNVVATCEGACTESYDNAAEIVLCSKDCASLVDVQVDPNQKGKLGTASYAANACETKADCAKCIDGGQCHWVVGEHSTTACVVKDL